MTDRGLYLGARIDGSDRVVVDMDHLTTHAVCLGMTGSGKTGLGIVALEELARRGVPLLIIDLKGDMVNLLLNFPDFSPGSFAPWLPVDEVEGRDRTEVAGEQAEMWRSGLARSGLGSDDLRAVRDGLEWRLLTPGVASAAPVDILPALSPPEGWDPAGDPDGATDRVNGIAGAILSLVGRGGDPLSDRDHVLTASVILDHWNRGRGLDLAGLLASLADPSIEVLGALPLDVFYPRDDRMKLVLALNTLLASPAFRAWTLGTPLAMEELLGTDEVPCASIVSVAHLDDRQRLFIIGLLVSELVAWMRRQPASAGIRALLYMDEVQGILPPHPANPPTKGPLLTLFKQGRAFGVGAWLATQNPVDLDYKALGNAGVKLVGRLITDRDRERALEGLGLTILEDGRDADHVVARLGKREFLLDDVRHEPRVRVLSSRWAMSYLRGPVTLAEMGPLLAGAGGATGRESQAAATQPPSASGHRRQSPRPPVMEHDVPMRFAVGGTGLASPSLVFDCRTNVRRKSLGFSRELIEHWRLPIDHEGRVLWDEAEQCDEACDVVEEPPVGMLFPGAAPAGLGKELAKIDRDIIAWRARQPVKVLANPGLKLVAEPDESREAFIDRCLEAADRADDATQERTRARYVKRMKTLEKRIARETDELERDREQLASRRAEETFGVVEGLLSVLLGSKSLRSASTKAASRVRSAASKRRIRQRAGASVTESEREIVRLENELEDLADELQDEIDRIAEASEVRAEAVEEVPIRPIQRDVGISGLRIVWG
jgi:hypothetical protein